MNRFRMKRLVQNNGSNSLKRLRLPMLDIQRWHNDPDGFASDLREASHNVGFFIIRHDFQQSLTEQLMGEVRTFFQSTPLETKMSMSYEHSSSFRGYMALGVENTSGEIDHREQVELASETPYRNSSASDHCLPYERLRGKNQWPTELQPNLQIVVEEYVQHMLGLCQNLTQALSFSLTGDKHALDSLFYRNITNHKSSLNNYGANEAVSVHDPFWQCKLASYSSKFSACHRQQKQGVGEHTDSGFLTLILQDDATKNSGGLQVFHDGEWMDVAPGGPDVLVCNLGEIAQLSTGGYLRATPHRVMMNPHMNGSAYHRTSIPFFYNPTLDSVVKENMISLSSDILDEIKNGTMMHWGKDKDYYSFRQSTKQNIILPQYGDNAFKSLARSHPTVFAKHHPDLRVLENGQVGFKCVEGKSLLHADCS